jgi:hypothetical protein
MKNTLLFLFLLTIISCKKEKSELAKNNIVRDQYQNLYGNWVGDFVTSKSDSLADENVDFVYSNKINLVIKKIENNKVYGQSIVAGNSRPLLVDFSEYNGEIRITLNEPGNKKNDGRFEFKIIGKDLEGKWFANTKKNPVWEREYRLTKQPFKYNPKLMLPQEREYVDWYSTKIDSTKEVIDGEEETYYDETYRSASDIITKLNASTTLLNESDLKNLKKLELEIIRNTIFARHGYTFKKKSFRQFFDPIDWYIPVTDNVSNKLTLLEKKNILLLNRFQKYAEDNYDSFGR